MPSNLQPILFLVAIAAVFYLLMIRPQQKKRKEMQSMLQALKPGSEIVTTAGMFGKVIALEGDDALLIEVAPGVTCKYMRQAVMRVVPDQAPAVSEPAGLPESDGKADSTDTDAKTADEATDKATDKASDSATDEAQDEAKDEPTSTVEKAESDDTTDATDAEPAKDGAAEASDESAANGDRRASS